MSAVGPPSIPLPSHRSESPRYRLSIIDFRQVLRDMCTARGMHFIPSGSRGRTVPTASAHSKTCKAALINWRPGGLPTQNVGKRRPSRAKSARGEARKQRNVASCGHAPSAYQLFLQARMKALVGAVPPHDQSLWDGSIFEVEAEAGLGTASDTRGWRRSKLLAVTVVAGVPTSWRRVRTESTGVARMTQWRRCRFDDATNPPKHRGSRFIKQIAHEWRSMDDREKQTWRVQADGAKAEAATSRKRQRAATESEAAAAASATAAATAAPLHTEDADAEFLAAAATARGAGRDSDSGGDSDDESDDPG